MRNAKSKYVTKTGRVIAPGRVTRASHLVRTRAKGDSQLPLPAHLQCHPKALSPTSKNPGCVTYGRRDLGRAAAMTLTREQINDGVGLSESGRFAIVRISDLKQLGCTDDVVYALAYQRRAAYRLTAVEVIDNGH